MLSDSKLALLGAVPIKARLYRMEFLNTHADFLHRLSVKAQEVKPVDTFLRDRLNAASVAFETCLRGALFSSYCYFEFYRLRCDYMQGDGFQLADAALDFAHTFADVVPVELFNAKMLAESPEFEAILGQSSSVMSELFEQSFPGTKAARDAVCHYHDRALGRFGKKDLQIGMLGRSITDQGKVYSGSDGADFEFTFSEGQFARYFAALELIVK